MNQGAFVYHVGIWLGQQRFVHSSRQFGGVVVSSMDPGGEKHSPQYATDFCYARRIGRL
jgi:cell wall-associated NlpC family hydrolase